MTFERTLQRPPIPGLDPELRPLPPRPISPSPTAPGSSLQPAPSPARYRFRTLGPDGSVRSFTTPEVTRLDAQKPQQPHRNDKREAVAAVMPRASAVRSWRLSVHGAGVEIDCAVPSLHDGLRRWLDFFAEDALPNGFSPATGSVEPYDAAEVVRHLPPDAKRLRRRSDTVEYYELDERFWIVDERWGMAE